MVPVSGIEMYGSIFETMGDNGPRMYVHGQCNFHVAATKSVVIHSRQRLSALCAAGFSGLDLLCSYHINPWLEHRPRAIASI